MSASFDPDEDDVERCHHGVSFDVECGACEIEDEEESGDYDDGGEA